MLKLSMNLIETEQIMTQDFIFHILTIISSAFCLVTLVSYILFKNCSIAKKINASVYIIALGVYLYFSEYLGDFVQSYYSSHYDYNYIMLNIITILSLLSVVVVFVGIFSKNQKFNEKTSRIFEFIWFLVAAALIWSIFVSQMKSLFLVPIVLLNLVFVEHCLINSTENLDNRISKLVYFVLNSLIAAFWIIGIFAVIITNSVSFNKEFIILLSIVLLFSFESIINGIIRIKKESKND